MSDLIPPTAHLPLPWIMGYDLEPLRTLESKRAFLDEATRGGWKLVFEHDPAVAAGRPVREGKDTVLQDVIAAPRAAEHPNAGTPMALAALTLPTGSP